MPARPLRLFVAIVVAACCALPGSSSAARAPVAGLSNASAARFFLAEVRAKVRGDWAAAWASLYPRHQRVAPLSAFVRCEQATPFPAPLDSLRVVRVRGGDVRVPGAHRPVHGVAVVAAVELRWYGPRDPIVFRHTFHLVPVDGRWRWLLSPSRYRLYANGGCGVERLAAQR